MEKLKAISEAQNFPLSQCEGVAGFYVEDIATEILPKARIKKALLKKFR